MLESLTVRYIRHPLGCFICKLVEFVAICIFPTLLTMELKVTLPKIFCNTILSIYPIFVAKKIISFNRVKMMPCNCIINWHGVLRSIHNICTNLCKWMILLFKIVYNFYRWTASGRRWRWSNCRMMVEVWPLASSADEVQELSSRPSCQEELPIGSVLFFKNSVIESRIAEF